MTGKDTYYGVTVDAEQRAAIDRERLAKKQEHSNASKVLRRFAKMVKPLGFQRKRTWFAREAGPLIQFIHIHKYTFGPHFRLHYGIRVLNDPKEYTSLNGPSVERGLEFEDDNESLTHCAEAMLSIVEQRALGWFEHQTPGALVDSDGCLYQKERVALEEALSDRADSRALQRSRDLFGLG